MLDPHGSRFRLLTKIGDLSSANLVAARLRAEGIESRIHSPSLGPYPVTVGDMALSEIWVSEDRIEDASQILLDIEAKSVVGFDEEYTPAATVAHSTEMRLAAAVFAVIMVALIARVLVLVY